MGSRVTDDMRVSVLKGISAGMTLTMAAANAGVGRTTIWRLAKVDEGFARALQIAEAQRQHVLMGEVREYGGARQDWRAPAWILEHTTPEFGQRVNVQEQAQRLHEAMIEAVRHHMSEGAFGELLDALEALRDEPKRLTG